MSNLGVVVVVLAVAACNDKHGAVDAAIPPDASPDASPTAVACRGALAVVRGTTTIDTCTGQDRLDGCGPPNTKELTIAFSRPDTMGYAIRVFPAGAPQVGTGIPITSFDSTCSQILLDNCGVGVAGLLANIDTTYAIVEAPTGGCGMFDVVVSGPIQAIR